MTFDLFYNDFVNIANNASSKNSTFFIDTQADISVFKLSSLHQNLPINTSNIIRIKGITNDAISSLGTAHIDLYLDNHVLSHKFHIVPDNFNINTDGIIGKDFLSQYNCSLDYQQMIFTINDPNFSNILKISSGPDSSSFIIPPRCEVIRKFQIDSQDDCVVDNHEIAEGVFAARTIVKPHSAYIRVMNTSDIPRKISNRITRFEPLHNFICYQTDEVKMNAERNEQLDKILIKQIPTEFQSELLPLIHQYSDIFALPDDQMTTNNFYEQNLRIIDKNPVYIKNYRTPHSQKSEISDQINKLLKNELIEPS